jgi:hypothetical protein
MLTINCRGAKPTQLFAHQDSVESNTDESDHEPSSNDAPPTTNHQPPKMDLDDENPF